VYGILLDTFLKAFIGRSDMDKPKRAQQRFTKTVMGTEHGIPGEAEGTGGTMPHTIWSSFDISPSSAFQCWTRQPSEVLVNLDISVTVTYFHRHMDSVVSPCPSQVCSTAYVPSSCRQEWSLQVAPCFSTREKVELKTFPKRSTVNIKCWSLDRRLFATLFCQIV